MSSLCWCDSICIGEDTKWQKKNSLRIEVINIDYLDKIDSEGGE